MSTINYFASTCPIIPEAQTTEKLYLLCFCDYFVSVFNLSDFCSCSLCTVLAICVLFLEDSKFLNPCVIPAHKQAKQLVQ